MARTLSQLLDHETENDFLKVIFLILVVTFDICLSLFVLTHSAFSQYKYHVKKISQSKLIDRDFTFKSPLNTVFIRLNNL